MIATLRPLTFEGLAPPAGICVVPYVAANRRDVVALLHELPVLYPGGAEWLQRRLTDVEHGYAYCRLVWRDEELVGVAIETPKPVHRLKLSTLFVRPDVRRRGVGRFLTTMLVTEWLSTYRTNCYVTVAQTRCGALNRLLQPLGFSHTITVEARYGADRNECVLSWRP